jgi:Protein of unknown function (DUF1592)/Protein of unknown function (DUF1588)/Protein of unknown function (DUF1595)/Protein of unknown function (DUF1587)/Protein of unknown function (DUF1585)
MTGRRLGAWWLGVAGLTLVACTGEIGAPSGAAGAGSGASAGTGSGAGAGSPTSLDGVGASTRVARLTNAQWENTVTDLLHLDGPSGLSARFTAEPPDRGYDTVAASELTIGSYSAQSYASAAAELAGTVSADASKLSLLAPSGQSGSARRDAFLKSFGRRAYRRPLGDQELSTFQALFDTATGGDDAKFAEGVAITVEAMLQSPYFLYRVERSTPKSASDAKSQLDGFEVATRLSYALWHTTPSDALLDAAQKGELDSAEGVARWGKTLLADPRAKPVLVSFLEQSFGVSAYGTQDKADSLGFDAAALAPTLRAEARAFLENVVLGSAGGLTALLTSSTGYVNADTAPYYGLSGVDGAELEPRELPASERAGLFTQLGFLTKNATRSGSDPVHRGLAIVRKVLCDEPNPPPMMFTLPVPEPGLTTREVYEKATACGAGCHDTLINPPGFAFESFDTLGKFRTTEAGKQVDTSGSLTIRDGFEAAEKAAGPTEQLEFSGAVDMLQKLADTPRVHECYARNVMAFVLGRELSGYERGVSRSLGAASLGGDDTTALITSLLSLDTFRARVDALE